MSTAEMNSPEDRPITQADYDDFVDYALNQAQDIKERAKFMRGVHKLVQGMANRLYGIGLCGTLEFTASNNQMRVKVVGKAEG